MFGIFEKVTEYIRGLPETLDGLLGSILSRLIREDESGVVEKVGFLISGLRVFGIIEKDDEYICLLSGTQDGLLSSILSRLIREDESGVVEKVGLLISGVKVFGIFEKVTGVHPWLA